MAAAIAGPTTGTIPNSASAVILGPQQSVGDQLIYVAAAADRVFRIDLEISGDGGATWTIVKSVASAVGNDATLVNAAELSQVAPTLFRVSLKNTIAATMTYAADARAFMRTQR